MFVRTLQPLGGKIEECKAEHFYEYKRRRKLDVTTYLLYDTRVKIKHEIENSYLSLFKYRILGRASIVYNHPEKIEMLLTKDGLICKYLLDNHKSIFGFECENMNCKKFCFTSRTFEGENALRMAFKIDPLNQPCPNYPFGHATKDELSDVESECTVCHGFKQPVYGFSPDSSDCNSDCSEKSDPECSPTLTYECEAGALISERTIVEPEMEPPPPPDEPPEERLPKRIKRDVPPSNGICYCTSCNIFLGEMNPRQLCGKWRCNNEGYWVNYDTLTGNFLSMNQIN